MPVLDVLTPRHHPHLLLTASEDGILASIDRRNRKLLRKLNFGAASFPMSMAVVDGDNCLYVGDKKGGLRLIDATGGNLKTVITCSPTTLNYFRFCAPIQDSFQLEHIFWVTGLLFSYL